MITIWKKIKEEPFKTGFRKLIKKTFQLPNNRITDFDIKHEGPVACILALTEDNKVILTKQFRPGPEKILLELPGGDVDADETPEESIKREFLEETGHTGDIKFVGTSLDCAYSTRIRYNFVATNCRKVQDQNLEENEFIQVVEMSLDDFRKHLRSGELSDVEGGYLGLDFLRLL
ncbi:NUDIX hydrolase [Patescibacteria group bacterium AH-259-L07]|nr:NUDIX hydrolase [Patescibacteria group bacterium AH-259-L07]